MKLTLKRTGGVAGIPLSIKIDTDELSRPEAEFLHRLVREADFFSLEELLRVPHPMPDRFSYRICVEHEGRVKEIETDEASIPPACKPLVRHILKLKRQSRSLTDSRPGPS